MDPTRQTPRAVIDPIPKYRQVGFFTHRAPPRSQSGPPDPTHSPPVSDISPSANSLSPVMIPPPRHLSDNLVLHVRPTSSSPLRSESVAVGSGGSSSFGNFFPAPMSPQTPASSSYSSRFAAGDGSFFDCHGSGGGGGKGSNAGKVASSFSRGGFDLTAMNKASGGGGVVPASELTTVSVVNDSLGIPMLGTRESALGKTCAASSMEWSIQLEKGLRSSKPGVPVQAILQLGPLLMQWSSELESAITPDATSGCVPGEVRLFANAILLRLADAFRTGDKEIKLSVVTVFLFEREHRDIVKKHRQCKGLLSRERIANHLELWKQVKYVYFNGDLESKALALVVFGCWADFTNDFAQIRYLILSSLTSTHDCEVKAALFAAGCFSETSDDFGLITLEMLLRLMNSSTTSLPIKLAAAQIFGRFKCLFTVARKAYNAGVLFVSKTSDEDILVAMLVSLTELCSIFALLASLLEEFLVSFINRERTPRVQETALRCLRLIAQRGPILIPSEKLSSLQKLVQQCSTYQGNLAVSTHPHPPPPHHHLHLGINVEEVIKSLNQTNNWLFSVETHSN